MGLILNHGIRPGALGVYLFIVITNNMRMIKNDDSDARDVANSRHDSDDETANENDKDNCGSGCSNPSG